MFSQYLTIANNSEVTMGKIICSFFVFAQIHCFSQNGGCENRLDTLYYLSVNGVKTEENNRPAFVALFVKEFQNVKINRFSVENALCNLYGQSIYTTDPLLGFELMSTKCTGRLSNQEQEKLVKVMIRRVKEMRKKQLHFSLLIDRKETITIGLNKIIGYFWKMPYSNQAVNNISHQYVIPDSCYNEKYFYYVKEIKEVLKISEKERQEFEKKIL